MIWEKRSALYKISLLIADILILLFCLGGLYLISIKAGLPFKTSLENSSLIVSEKTEKINDVMASDEIISIDGHPFTKWEEVELYLDGKRNGEVIYLELKRNGSTNIVAVKLTNYYALFDLMIISLVGLTFFGMGVFVRLNAKENFSAQIFHWASVGLGVVIVITAGYYDVEPFGYGHFNRIFWLLVYSVTPVLFIHFTSSFTKKKVKGIKFILSHSPIVATVSVADTITRLSGIGYDGDHRPNPGSSIPRAMLNIGAEELERLRSFAEAKRPEIEAFFRLAA